MENNASLELGDVRLHFWNTPGHTLESVCVLVSEDKASLTVTKANQSQVKAIFTGDTVFAGDVGRPDLAVSTSKNLTSKDLAGMMFDSVQRLKQLPGHVVLYPGHGAGSSCGKNISSATVTSIQEQKDTNYAFNLDDKPSFISELTANVPPPPDYFFYNSELNQTSDIAPIEEILKRSFNPLSPSDFLAKATDGNHMVLDCRDPDSYMSGHVPNSLFSPLNMKFAIWAADMIGRPDKDILIVCFKGTSKECITRLARTGMHNVVGFLEDFAAYEALELPLEQIETVSADSVFDTYKSELPGEEYQILDVRGHGEWRAGHIDSANFLCLDTLNKNYSGVVNQESKPAFLHCQGGVRSLIAISYLKSKGYKNLFNITGGFASLAKLAFKIVKK